MTYFLYDFGTDFRRKIMLFAIKTIHFDTHWQERMLLSEIALILDRNRSQNRRENMSKIYNFYFYVGNA